MSVDAATQPERLLAVAYGLAELREFVPPSAAPEQLWREFAVAGCGDARDARRQALGMGRVR